MSQAIEKREDHRFLGHGRADRVNGREQIVCLARQQHHVRRRLDLIRGDRVGGRAVITERTLDAYAVIKQLALSAVTNEKCYFGAAFCETTAEISANRSCS